MLPKESFFFRTFNMQLLFQSMFEKKRVAYSSICYVFKRNSYLKQWCIMLRER